MIYMKAWVLHSVDDIRYEDIDKPSAEPGEVLVKVKAAGICGSDIPRIYQTGAHCHPLVPGHEYSGQVVEVGKDTDEKWNGKRVGIFPLIPCKECAACKMNKYEMCRNYSYLGSRRNGGFAEYVAVPEWNLIELPVSVSYKEAAMLEPMAVATHAIRRVNPIVGEKIVICGLGTIGLLLLMILKNELESMAQNNGCDIDIAGDIFVIGNKEFQKKQVLSLGIKEENYLDCKFGNVTEWVLGKTNGIGASVFFECVGKNETVENAIDVTAPAGRVCLAGNPYSDMNLHKNVYWKILRNQLQVTGTWNSSFNHNKSDDWNYVLDKLKCECFHPEKMISHTYKLEDLEKGLHIMRDKTEDYLKIMVEM